MKRLSDYQGEEAFELWADLLDPITAIIGDPCIQEIVKSDKPKLEIAKEILRSYKKEASEIMLRIDPEPLNGLNIVVRLAGLITEIGENPDIQSFFVSAEQEKLDEIPSGSAMANTGEKEK